MNQPIESIETVALPIVAPGTRSDGTTIPMLEFPRLYIVAPVSLPGHLRAQERRRGRKAGVSLSMDEEGCVTGLAVCNLETVEARPFDAWLSAILTQAKLDDSVLLAAIAGFDHERWPIMDKWWCINELAERGVSLGLYDSAEKAQAAMSMMPAYQGSPSPEMPESEVSDE